MTAKEFIHTLPTKVNPSAIEGMTTCFHFQLSGEGGGDVTVEIADGKCTVHDGLVGEANCNVKASDETFMGLIKGTVNPMMAMMSGKIKISNTGEMLKYAKILGLM
jgi:putative sterol carrier protein